MSVTILDPAHPPRERSSTWGPPTEDLESTADVHEESTTDLAPSMQDATPEDVAPEDVAIALAPAPVPASVAPAEPAGAARMLPTATPATSQRSASSAAQSRRAIVLGPGTVLCERYLIEQMIGRGGTAVVFRARDMLSSSGSERNLQIAIKAPRPDVTDRARAVARLRHEFENATRLSHPNVVRVMEFHDDPAHCFIAMELIEGRLLSSLVRDWTMLPPPLTQKILRDCAEALTYAHLHGVVHGDFKPGNVFVTADEEVKVVDFGASALIPGTDESRIGSDESRIAAGTPAYASPEVLGGATPEPRDDVFSFACVAYELLTGQHPFERHSSLRARSEGIVPQRAWSLSAKQWLAVLSAMSWERAQRPADIETLMAALADESVTPSPVAPIHATPMPTPSTELRADLMPRPSSWGFFVFIACAIAVIVIAIQRPRQAAPPAAAQVSANAPPKAAAMMAAAPAPQSSSAQARAPVTEPQTPERSAALAPEQSAGAASTSKTSPSSGSAAAEPAARRGAATPGAGSKATPPAPAAAASLAPSSAGHGKASAAATAKAAATPKAAPAAPASSRPAAPVSQISFESRSVVTSESSVAAVFVIKRSPPLKGRARVQWSAVSGTAQEGVDFAANAHGTIEFADGQSQRAIYVPLRNDLLKEGDETFSVQLQSPQGAKLGPIARAEATIRDDD